MRTDSCESCFINDILLICVAFKKVHFRFGLEDTDIQFNFRNIFRYLSLFPIRIVNNFLLYFTFNPRSLLIAELEKHGSGSTTINDNKIRFPEVHLFVPIRLTGKLEFSLFLFYTNQCIFSDGPPLVRLLEKPVVLLLILGSGFGSIRLKM